MKTENELAYWIKGILDGKLQLNRDEQMIYGGITKFLESKEKNIINWRALIGPQTTNTSNLENER